MTLTVHVDGEVYARQPHGGISRNFTNLICALDLRDDIEVVLYAACGSRVPRELSAVRRVALPGTMSLRPSRVFRGLNRVVDIRRARRFWNRLQSGVFHSTYYTSPVGVGVPQVLSLQDMIYEDYPDLFNGVQQRAHAAAKAAAIERASAFIFSSRFGKARAAAHFDIGDRPTLVSPYAVDPAFLVDPDESQRRTFRERYCNGRPYLLHVGARYLHKNVSRLLAAFAGWSRRAEFALVLAGGGPLSDEESRMLRDWGASDNVVVVPRLEDGELVVAYSGATAFVFPSLSEGFGFPVLEALACGCPTACSAAASMPEVGGQEAIYFDPLDEGHMRRALDDVLAAASDVDRWRRAKDRARTRTWMHVACDYVGLYGEVAASRFRRAAAR